MKSILSTQICEYHSPFGTFYLMADSSGLKGLTWKRPDMKSVSAQNEYIDQAKKELSEYFLGLRSSFTVKLSPEGTAFQMEVWRKLGHLPFGRTASYKDLCSMLGRPGAQRAVGGANGKNPLPIFIPCHRVISSSGGLGGYSGGLELKKRLLELEGALVS